MNGYEGMCMSWGKFLKPWQVTDNIIEWIFSQFTFKILWVTLTQKIITHRVSKIHERFWGNVYEQGGSFSSHDKWEIKLLSEFFPKFTFNILWVTLTQKIITRRVLKIHDWIWGDVYEWRKVSINYDKWQIKFFKLFIFQFILILQLHSKDIIINCNNLC